MDHNEWRSIAEPAPEGIRLHFYAPEWDFIFIGVTRGGRWFDEGEIQNDGRAPEIVGVTHWMPMPTKPFREQ
jgi:hypothetical protein